MWYAKRCSSIDQSEDVLHLQTGRFWLGKSTLLSEVVSSKFKEWCGSESECEDVLVRGSSTLTLSWIKLKEKSSDHRLLNARARRFQSDRGWVTSSVHVCVCHLAAKVDWEWDRLSCFTIVLNRRVIFKHQKWISWERLVCWNWWRWSLWKVDWPTFVGYVICTGVSLVSAFILDTHLGRSLPTGCMTVCRPRNISTCAHG